MKKNDLQSLRKSSKTELEKKVQDLNTKLVELKLKMQRGELANRKEPKNIRHDIAQIKTIMTEQALLEATK